MSKKEICIKKRNKYDCVHTNNEEKKYIKTDPDNQFCINCGWFNKGTSPRNSNSICNCDKSKFYKKETFARDSCEFWKQWNVKKKKGLES